LDFAAKWSKKTVAKAGIPAGCNDLHCGTKKLYHFISAINLPKSFTVGDFMFR